MSKKLCEQRQNKWVYISMPGRFRVSQKNRGEQNADTPKISKCSLFQLRRSGNSNRESKIKKERCITVQVEANGISFVLLHQPQIQV